MLEKILDRVNLEKAYLEIIRGFSIKQKTLVYHGLDNHFLKDYELDSCRLLSAWRQELIDQQPIDPPISVLIPKKNKPNNWREIFIYSIKERVKAQAIYRVLLPFFEEILSDRLFSYRPGQSPHLAAKQFCRNYRLHCQTDQALILDLKNYANQINHQILIDKLKTVIEDEGVIDLLKLFISGSIYRQGVVQLMTRGVVVGIPLYAILSNFYISELDFKYKKLVNFYVRVGDDIAMLDCSAERILSVKNDLLTDLKRLDLIINDDKIYSGQARGEYNFLGYSFNEGQISLPDSLVKGIIDQWKNILAYKNINQQHKINLLKNKMKSPATNYNNQFRLILKSKPQVNDYQQIRNISETFFKIMTKFIYGHYSPRHRRLAMARLKNIGIISPYQLYRQAYYD